ncbi:MAG: CHASE3 domain-containing protein [Candidatus Nitrosotalea sp.]|nr:CHASE3 domain-containing protein [Candidatus Nitrosotalea sp.]
MFQVNSYTSWIIIGTLLPIIAFSIVSCVSFISINNLIENENWLSHTFTVIDKADYFMKTMVDAETGQRGYLITGQENFLEPYNSATSQIDDQIKALRQLTMDNPIQQSNMDRLEPLVKKRLDLLDLNISLRKSNNALDIVKNFDTTEGKKTMDEIRQVIENMKNEEQQLLAKRNLDTQSAIHTTEYVIILGTSIAVILTVMTTLVVNKKLAERQKLERANIELQVQSQQLRETDVAKEEFTTMISHELKTPLVTISGYAEMLKEDNSILGPLNSEQIDAVTKISAETTKLERLISDIMDAQKIDLERMKFNKKEFGVKEFLDEQIQTHSKLMSDKKILFVNTTDEKINIVSDQYRLSQVFANLIKNAVDFVPPNHGSIEINAQRKNGHVVFYVKDNGSGIPKEKQDNLFKKFYQVDTSLKRRHGGTGLGLVICKGIVEALGGKIWLESEVGKGTTIFFTLPKNDLNEKYDE